MLRGIGEVGLDGIDFWPVFSDMVGHPFDCFGQPFFKGDVGFPVKDLFGFFGGAEKAFDFGIFGSDALGVGDDFDGFAHELGDQVSEVADADFAVAAEVDGLPEGGFGASSSEEAFDRVADVVEVASGGEGAELYSFALIELADDGGNDSSGGLSRPEGVEGADCDEGDTEGKVERFGDFIGPDFGRGVRGLALEGMVFGDGDLESGSVTFAGAGVDDALGAEGAGGIDDVHRAFDVGADVTTGSGIAVWDCNEGGQVEDDVLSGHGFDD